ncbi:MAG: hypothetical protein O9246_01325 [Brevundimonas sp.]|nr:hypothetical protein [Brevundimonas sp.]
MPYAGRFLIECQKPFSVLATNGANAILERAALLHLRNHKVIALRPITLEAEYGL